MPRGIDSSAASWRIGQPRLVLRWTRRFLAATQKRPDNFVPNPHDGESDYAESEEDAAAD